MQTVSTWLRQSHVCCTRNFALGVAQAVLYLHYVSMLLQDSLPSSVEQALQLYHKVILVSPVDLHTKTIKSNALHCCAW